MPSQLVCPNCGSRKIGKEHGEKEYYCDACTEFFVRHNGEISGKSAGLTC